MLQNAFDKHQVARRHGETKFVRHAVIHEKLVLSGGRNSVVVYIFDDLTLDPASYLVETQLRMTDDDADPNVLCELFDPEDDGNET